MARLSQRATFQPEESILTLMTVIALSAVSTVNTQGIISIIGTMYVSTKKLQPHTHTYTHHGHCYITNN